MTTTKPAVLLVDDDTQLLQSLKLVLEDDCEVVSCDSPIEALKLGASRSFDVVVVDLKMPVMSGTEFVGEYRKVAMHTPRFLMVTGTPQEVTHKVPNASELVMVLPKPVDPMKLLKLVTSLGKPKQK